MAHGHRILHPCLWFTEQDRPRLRANVQTPFWKPKIAARGVAVAGRR